MKRNLLFVLICFFALSILYGQKSPKEIAEELFTQSVSEFNAGNKDKAVETFIKAYTNDQSVLDYDSGKFIYYLFDTLIASYQNKAVTQSQDAAEKQKILDKVSQDLKTLKQKVMEGSQLQQNALKGKDEIIKRLENEIDDLKAEIQKGETENSRLNDALQRELHLKKVWRQRAKDD